MDEGLVDGSVEVVERMDRWMDCWVCLGDEGGWMDGLWVDGWMTG